MGLKSLIAVFLVLLPTMTKTGASMEEYEPEAMPFFDDDNQIPLKPSFDEPLHTSLEHKGEIYPLENRKYLRHSAWYNAERDPASKTDKDSHQKEFLLRKYDKNIGRDTNLNSRYQHILKNSTKRKEPLGVQRIQKVRKQEFQPEDIQSFKPRGSEKNYSNQIRKDTVSGQNILANSNEIIPHRLEDAFYKRTFPQIKISFPKKDQDQKHMNAQEKYAQTLHFNKNKIKTKSTNLNGNYSNDFRNTNGQKSRLAFKSGKAQHRPLSKFEAKETLNKLSDSNHRDYDRHKYPRKYKDNNRLNSKKIKDRYKNMVAANYNNHKNREDAMHAVRQENYSNYHFHKHKSPHFLPKYPRNFKDTNLSKNTMKNLKLAAHKSTVVHIKKNSHNHPSRNLQKHAVHRNKFGNRSSHDMSLEVGKHNHSHKLKNTKFFHKHSRKHNHSGKMTLKKKNKGSFRSHDHGKSSKYSKKHSKRTHNKKPSKHSKKRFLKKNLLYKRDKKRSHKHTSKKLHKKYSRLKSIEHNKIGQNGFTINGTETPMTLDIRTTIQPTGLANTTNKGSVTKLTGTSNKYTITYSTKH